MRFDDTLQTGLSRILNVDLSNGQWLQALLPVGNGGLGVQSAMMLAPSAFLASAASTLELQQSILPEGIKDLTDQSVVSVENIWTSLSGTSVPTSEARHIQKAWDSPVAVNHIDQLLSRTSNEVDKARLLAATATHFGDWLPAAPIASVCLKLSDEAVRVAVAHRLGCRACEPHTFACAKNVDARGLHGLACRRSALRQQRHSLMNDILWR